VNVGRGFSFGQNFINASFIWLALSSGSFSLFPYLILLAQPLIDMDIFSQSVVGSARSLLISPCANISSFCSKVPDSTRVLLHTASFVSAI